MADRRRPEYERLADTLRQLRLERGLTQEDLAARLGVRQEWVSKYEVQERRLDVVELSDIAEALEVPVVTILKQAGIHTR